MQLGIRPTLNNDHKKNENYRMNILVTGCAGFIGQKVAEKLIERGDKVIGVDNLNDFYDPRLKEWRLGILQKFENFAFYRQDIENHDALEKIFETHNIDAVINLAARAGIRVSVENPWIYYDTNVKGTLNLLECCKIHDVNKFLLASSSSVYGLNDIPFSENNFTDTPLSPYAASKKSAEVLCYTYHHLYGLDVTIPRYFTVYGPAGRPDMAVFKFINSIDEGKQIEIYGDGKQSRDFTFIDDIAEGTIRGLQLKGFNIFNLGDNKPVELLEIIKLIEQSLGKKTGINFQKSHAADVFTTCADICLSEGLLGWKPGIAIAEGIGKTVNWYVENRNWINNLDL